MSKISKNITSLSKLVIATYETNTEISVDSIKNFEVKKQLKALNVHYIDLRYRFDSTHLTKYELQFFHRSEIDSLLIFGRSKDPNFGFDIWRTENEVGYYFGVNKPKIKSVKSDEFSNLTRKLNDSMYFSRSHFPPIR